MDARQNILGSAEKLFLHYGFRKTTVADVAREAGVAKGSIYLHFDSKEDLLFDLIRQKSRIFLDELELVIEKTTPARLALTDGLVDFMARGIQARRRVATEDLNVDFALISKILDIHREAEPRLGLLLRRALEQHCQEAGVTMNLVDASWLLTQTIMFILVRTIKDTNFDWQRYINTMTELMLPRPEVEVS